jgi:hypothetical protein
MRVAHKHVRFSCTPIATAEKLKRGRLVMCSNDDLNGEYTRAEAAG